MKLNRLRTISQKLITILLLGLSVLKVNAQTDYYIGSGTTANASTGYPTPYGDWFASDRHQFLYLASELIAAGMGPGLITAVKWDVTATNSGVQDLWQASMGTTTASSLTSWQPNITWPIAGPMSTSYVPNVGINTYTLPTPFIWNGTDNIVIQTCHGAGTGSFSYNASVRYHTTSFQSTYYYYTDNAGNLCNTTSSYGSTTTRPNIIFTYGQPCTGVPSGYTVNAPNEVCPNVPFTAALTGPFLSNLTYQWQYSFNGTSWANYTGNVALNGSIVDSITTAKWYRCKITCTNSGQTFTTPGRVVNIAPFYYCYCNNSKSAITTGLDIGNVKVIQMPSTGIGGDTLLNNGTATPLTGNTNANKTYSGFQYSVQPVVMYRDSQYRAVISQITSAASTTAGNVVAFIDFDRNGDFDTVTERVFNKTITSPTGYDADTFTVPSNAEIGLTGMRVIIKNGATGEPCGGYNEGETEDYLVDLRYEPCTGKPVAGIAQGDTSVCVGYDYLVTDTTYERRKSEIIHSWSVSADNVSWFNVTGSTGKDTLMRVFTGQPLYYRMQVVCAHTNDTATGAPIYVNQKVAYKCYCYSQAIGGKASDSSDIGGVSIAGYVANDGGTHLDNPKAYRKHSDHTDETPIVLNMDSLYQISVYHIMRGAEHADAKITIFMDFNNNHNYDIPDERIFTGFTSVGNFTLIDHLTIPALTIPGKPTGMRVILNNDIGPNIPSDDACGSYTSGETEDYMVIFQKSIPATVNDMGLIQDVDIYPNPNAGKFILQLNTTKAVSNIHVTVTNVTGQKMLDTQYEHNGGRFVKELDMTGVAKGVYFVEVQANGAKTVKRVVVQ